MTLLSAVVSAQSYIQVNRAYSGSGVDKALTLTVRNLSNKEMVIRNDYPVASCVNYKYLNNSGTVLYDNICNTFEDKYLTIIPAQSSKSFTFGVGNAARYLNNKNDIKTIRLRILIDYSISGFGRNIFDATDSVLF